MFSPVSVEGRTYEERACCESGGNVPSESCQAEHMSVAVLVGICSAAIVFLCGCCCCCYKVGRSRMQSKSELQQIQGNARTNIGAVPSSSAPTPASYIHSNANGSEKPTQMEPEINLGASYNNGVSIVATPVSPYFNNSSAPPMNPSFDGKY